MAKSRLQPWQSFSFGRWVCMLVVGVFFLIFLLPVMFSGSETTHEAVLIGDQLVDVTIKASFRRGLAMDHSGISIGRDHFSYKVTLKFPGGQTIIFHTKAQPEAIWRLNGQLYFVGTDWVSYLTARLNANGTLTPISKRDLPPGQRNWNLGQPTKEQQQGLEYRYQEFAE